MLRLPRTLLWRLCLALIAIQIVVAIAFGTHAYRSARNFHYHQTMQELQRLVSVMEPAFIDVGEEIEQGGTDQSKHQLLALSRDAGVRVTLIDCIADPGRVLLDSHRDAALMDNHLQRPEVREALATGEGATTRHSDSVLMDMMYFARVIGDANGARVLRVAVPLTDVHADLRRLLWSLGTAGAGLLFVTLLLVYIVSRAFSGTISSLSSRASEMAAARQFEPIEEPSARELAPLISALNNMAQRLHDRIDELQVHQHEHEAILQSMHSGVIALDLDQRILRLNRAAETILGAGNHSANIHRGCTGRLLQEVVRSAELNEYVDTVMREESTAPAEFRLRSQPDLIVQATSSQLTDVSGSRVGVLVVLNDVTPLRRLESLRSDFAANVSHELRTPITNIKGYVETMLEVGVDNAEQARRFLDIIKRNSDRLAAIIEDILSLAWLEQPDTRPSLEREVAEIGPLIEAVVWQFQNAAEAKRITLTTKVPADLSASINTQLFEQAVANYVSNAIKYSPPETAVTVSASLISPDEAALSDGGPQKWIAIAVSDEGQGIAREHLPRVFERFYRVDKARSRELGGTGLGLAIVKHIALVHGGRVDVESCVGKGSTFRILLPQDA